MTPEQINDTLVALVERVKALPTIDQVREIVAEQAKECRGKEVDWKGLTKAAAAISGIITVAATAIVSIIEVIG